MNMVGGCFIFWTNEMRDVNGCQACPYHHFMHSSGALSLAGAALAAGDAPSADSVRQNAETAVQVRAGTQKKVEALSDQESDLAQAVEARAREVALLSPASWERPKPT
jgi:hypothetical protein